MSTLDLIGLIVLVIVIIIGVVIKLYTKRVLSDMDGIEPFPVGKSSDVGRVINGK